MSAISTQEVQETRPVHSDKNLFLALAVGAVLVPVCALIALWLPALALAPVATRLAIGALSGGIALWAGVGLIGVADLFTAGRRSEQAEAVAVSE